MELQPWQEYFIKQIESKPFVSVPPVENTGELTAQVSIEDFISHYCYTGNARLWTILSMLIKPKVIVEYGTAMGIRTRLFAKLNPEAIIHSIDKNPVAGTADAVSGLVAQQEDNVKLYIGDSSGFAIKNVDMCYIDGDHSFMGVWKDSYRAWANKSKDSPWVIIWDDYHLTSVKDGLDTFVKMAGCELIKFGGFCLTGTKEISQLGEN